MYKTYPPLLFVSYSMVEGVDFFYEFAGSPREDGTLEVKAFGIPKRRKGRKVGSRNIGKKEREKRYMEWLKVNLPFEYEKKQEEHKKRYEDKLKRVAPLFKY